MIFKQIPVGPLENFSYILGDEKTKESAVIDPGFEPDKILDEANELGAEIKYIILTHSHSDHAGAVERIKAETKASVVLHESEKGDIDFSEKLEPDVIVRDGENLKVGELEFKFIHTPGHTPGSMCILVENKLITGDTLFDGSIGRTDLMGSDTGQMEASLKKLAKLPDNTEIWPGHNYGTKAHSTIGEQKKINAFLAT